jgi:hypothetical protein
MFGRSIAGVLKLFDWRATVCDLTQCTTDNYYVQSHCVVNNTYTVSLNCFCKEIVIPFVKQDSILTA